ncbi:MAG: MFS transporter [Thermoplasmata archaeon]|nr:MAG: MFS transporter [Thermoplasmata archaeon]
MKRDRNINALMAFSILVGLTIGFNFTILPIHVIHLKHDLFWVGFITSLQYMALVIMTFVWGALSDKLGQRKNIIIYTNLVASIFYFFFPFADIIMLTVLRGIQVFFLASWILSYALATEYRPKAKGEILGWFTLFNAVGWGTGSLLSGFIYALDSSWFFYITGIFSILTALVLIPIKDPPRKQVKDTSFGSILKLKNIPEIWKLCFTVLILLIGNYMVFAVFSVYLKENAIPIPAIGVVIALSGLPSAGLASIVGKLCDTYGRKIILIIAIILYAFIWFIYGIIDNIWLVIALWLVPAYTFYTISTNALISDLTPSSERGRGIGLLNSFYNLGAFIGSITGGAVAALFGFQPTFLLAAFAVIISFFIAAKLKEAKR